MPSLFESYIKFETVSSPASGALIVSLWPGDSGACFLISKELVPLFPESPKKYVKYVRLWYANNKP